MNRAGALHFQIFAVLIALGVLSVPNPFLRALAILGLGVLIYNYERRLGMLVPASPGVMFWLGCTLSYILGAMGLALLQDAWDEFGIRFLNDALYYLGIGLSAYLGGTWVASAMGSRQSHRALFRDFDFRPQWILLLCVMFFAPVVFGTASEDATLYKNLVIGAVQSIESVPLILLAIYLYRGRPIWWLAGILFSSAFVVAIEGMIVGYGRSKFIYAIVSLGVVWLALHKWDGVRLSLRSRVAIGLLPVFTFAYFGVMTAYRDTVAFDRDISSEDRLQILRDSARTSGGFVIDNLTTLADRLAQTHGLELLGMADSPAFPRHGWTEVDLENILKSYVPKSFFPEKGQGLGRDIMEYYGFTTTNNIPPTLLADAFRRSGVWGIIGVYFVMGLLATSAALFLNSRASSVGPFLALYIGVSSIDFVSLDVIPLLQFYIYRLATSGLLIVVMLYLARVVPRGENVFRRRVPAPWKGSKSGEMRLSHSTDA